MAALRTRSITAKVTAEEYGRLEAVAGAQRISTWARDVLLHASVPPADACAILAEILALRTMLLNVQFLAASGQTVTTETMRALIERADRDKWSKAVERLTAVALGGVG
jgi:hypothetical protein